MSPQFSSDVSEVVSIAPSKRVRYLIPTYKKVYSAYKYDRKKYMEIWGKLRNLAIKYNNPCIFFRVCAYSVLKHCYLKKNGALQSLGDIKHIFRYSTLQDVFKMLADEIFNYQMTLNLGEWRIIKNGIVVYLDSDGNQAEIDGTQNMPIGERLKIHIRLLRLLRQGVKLKKAVKIAKKAIS